jgi:hypothetical protein
MQRKRTGGPSTSTLRPIVNPRVADALDIEVTAIDATINSDTAGLPPMPNPVTEDSLCEWIKEVVPLMDPKSKYRKSLMAVAQRHDFRKKKAGGGDNNASFYSMAS